MAEQKVIYNASCIKVEVEGISNNTDSVQTYMNVKNEPADIVEDVSSQEVASVKQELDIGLTEPNMHYTLPCEYEPANSIPLADSVVTSHLRESSHDSAAEQHDSRNLSSEKTTGNKEAAVKAEHGCRHCGECFNRVNHARDLPQSCDVCGKLNVYAMERHTDEDMFICDVCNKHFPERHNLVAHLKIHTDLRRHSCNICSKRFKVKSNLRQHESIHTAASLHSCGVCSKRFTLLRNLKNHEKIHAGSRPYRCDVCSRRFTLECNLIKHRSLHASERPFTCDVCGKDFKQVSHLNVHKRIHARERPYSCDICSKSFKCNETLTAHKNNHANGRLYSCDVCSKKCLRKSNLKKHKLIHVKKPPI